MSRRGFLILLLIATYFEARSCLAAGVELQLVSSKRDFVKSSVRALGEGIERGDFATVLRKAKTRESLLTLTRIFHSSALRKPVQLRCRYGAAPRKKRLLDLNHALEMRVDVPVSVPLKDAAVSFSVDRRADQVESATVLFSFSF
jgi:hypothetical protein